MPLCCLPHTILDQCAPIAQVGLDDQRSTVEEAVTPEMVAALPAEWLAVLRQGAEEADIKALLKVIEQIRERDAVVADALAKFAQDFEYDDILALLPGRSDILSE